MNAPDPAFFHAMPDRRERSEGAFIVACHGTLTRRLGLDIAIEAMALVHPRIPHARLMVIGTGDYLEVARQLVVRKQLEQCVVFIDQVPVHELPRLLAGVDVGLVPNRASNATRSHASGQVARLHDSGYPDDRSPPALHRTLLQRTRGKILRTG